MDENLASAIWTTSVWSISHTPPRKPGTLAMSHKKIEQRFYLSILDFSTELGRGYYKILMKTSFLSIKPTPKETFFYVKKLFFSKFWQRLSKMFHKTRSRSEKLSLETLFFEVGWEFSKIFDFGHFLEPRFRLTVFLF